MFKKIVIDIDNDVSQKYHNWAKEAVDEFLDFFPEYKDKFAVKLRKDWHETKYTITEEEFIKYKNVGLINVDYFVKQEDGTYLVPSMSSKWALEYAFDKKSNEINASKLIDARNEWSNYSVRHKHEYRPLSLVLTNKKLFGITNNNARQFAFALGSSNIGAVVSTATAGDKERFKRLIWHEFGHVFKATHENRRDVVNELGWHCTSEQDCIMAPYSSESLQKADDKMPFCSDCLSSMRDYISKMHGIAQEQAKEQQNVPYTTVNSVRPEGNDTGDNSYIKKLDSFFKTAAEKRQAEYLRNEESDHFQAQIKETNGIVTNIEATSLFNLSASAVDKDGKRQVPEMETFRDMVALARSNNSIIEFGDIKTPDFKAKLLLACLEAEPEMKMDGAPILNEEFLTTVSPEIRAAIEAILNKKKEKDSPEKSEDKKEEKAEKEQETKEENTEFSSQNKRKLSPLEESIQRRKYLLSTKEKQNKITPQEKAELDFYRFSGKVQRAKQQAKQKYGDVSPREAAWEEETGLKPANYKQFSYNRPADECWKVHLDVMPNRENETTKEVSEFLEKLEVNHKIFAGGDNGKGMTIYAGSYRDMQKLCFELKNRFEDKISLPPLYADQIGQEIPMAHIATARFMVPKDSENKAVFDSAYPWPISGISPARMDKIDSLAVLENIGKKVGVLDDDVEMVTASSHFTDAKSKYAVLLLEAYVSHELYAKHCGEFYYGKDKENFERKVFRNALPPQGSPERAKWDDAAAKYEAFLEEKEPERMQRFKDNIKKYKRIDFRKLPPMPQMSKNNRNVRE